MSGAIWALIALVIILIVLNGVLLVERYVIWKRLWAKIEEREKRADQLFERMLALKDQLFDRMLALKGIRPLAEPKVEEPRPRPLVFSRDELDSIQDRIKERLEIATLRGETITLAQAEAEVWASLGYSQPPNLNAN